MAILCYCLGCFLMLVISGFGHSWLLARNDLTVVFHILSGKDGGGDLYKGRVWVLRRRIFRHRWHEGSGQMPSDQRGVGGKLDSGWPWREGQLEPIH